MKKFVALVFASLLAFTCVASPPGTPQLGTDIAKFEMPAGTYDISVQDQALLNIHFAVDATCQDIGFYYLAHSSQDICDQSTIDAGNVHNLEISPFPSELGSDSWLQVLKRFQLGYIIYGFHRRSNSPHPGLS